MKRKMLGLFLVLAMVVGCLPNVVWAAFSPRTTAPSSSNQYYYSNLNLYYSIGYGMPNCTAYAYGRAYEILGSKPNLCPNNAGQWWYYNQENGYYPSGQEPKLGAIACWWDGGWSTGTRTGHVAVVEGTNGNTVSTSNSGWGSKNFWMQDRNKNSMNYTYNGKTYTFLGYIYIVGDTTPPTNIPDPVTDLHSSKTIYSCNEYITFNWSPSARTTEYWIYMWKDGQQLYSTNMGTNTSFTSAPTSAGKYTLIIRPGNSFGFNDSSKAFSFTVYDSIPKPVTDLHANKQEYLSSEYITFNWSPSENATEYWIYMWKDGQQLYSTNMGTNTSFTSAPTSAGKYTLIIRPGNSFGFNDSSKAFSFTVYDSLPTPTPITDYPFTVTKSSGLTTITNNTAKSQKATIIIAQYSGKALKDKIVKTVTFGANEKQPFIHSYGSDYKVFVWDSLEGMKPLAE